MGSNVDWKKITEDQVVQWQRRQHAVKNWIEEILGMELESEDLAGPLQTGVVLCHVMRRLDERAIPRIQEDTKQLFKLKENVEFFLAACKDIGVPPFKIFKGPDLWEGTGMVLVIESLVALAAIVEQQYEGAPQLVIDNGWKAPKLTDKQVIEIKKQLVRIKDKPTSGMRPKVSPQIVLKKLALMAGNGVDINTYVPAFIRFQSLVRGYLQRQRYKAMVRNVAYRSRVVHEIHDTESFYVKSMSQCINVWLNPLNEAIASGSPLISAADVKSIFSDIAVLYSFNSQLYSEIQSRVDSWGTYQCLGDIFLRLMDFLKVYTAYVQNFNTSMAVIERVQKKKEVAAYFQKCKEHPEGKSLDLASFLIMPVQRIPRYNLLLTDMMRHTWEDHPDYNSLKRATDKIQSIAAFINERKREAENVSKTLEISNKITGNDKINLTEPGRRYVREGLFNEGTKDEVVAYLFTDIVVLGKPSKKIKFKDSFKLQIAELKEGPAGSNTIEFVQLGKGKVLARLVAKSKKEVDDWVKDFKTTKAELANQAATKDKLGIDKGEKKPKISAEERLIRRTRATKAGAELEDEESEEVARLKQRQEALRVQLNEIKDPEGDKRSKRQTKAQRKDIVKLYEELQGELDEVEAALAQLQAPGPAKLKRKDAAPENTFATTNNLYKSSPQAARTKERDVVAYSQSAAYPRVDGNAKERDVAPGSQSAAYPRVDGNTSTATLTPTVDKSPLLGSSEKEIKQRKKEEKKAEKQKLKEEKKRAKEEKKAEKLRLKEEKKQASGTAAGGRARRGTIATASPSRDRTTRDVELSSPSSPRGLAAVADVRDVRAAESAKETPTKQGSSSSSSVSVSASRQQQTPAKAESTGEAEAKGRNDKHAEAASKKAEEKSESEESASRGGASSGGEGEFYPYEELKKIKDKLDRTKLEAYLSPEEFPKVFGMSREEFRKMPGWKQKQKKDEKDLL